MGKAKDLADKPGYLSSKAAKFALGMHRGPMPKESFDDENDMERLEKMDTLELETIKRTPTQTLRRHWFRFWCCYLFFSIIFLAIFLPIFFLVIIPAISQNVVNRSTLLLDSASVLEPRPNSIKLSLQSALKLPVALPVRIDPIALDLFNREQPYNNTWGRTYLDGIVIKGNTTMGVTDQPTPIDPEMWYDYVWKVVHLNHPPLSVRGSTNSYLGKLKSPVTLNKDIPQTTLNEFPGFAVDDSVLIEPREDGTNLLANATLPNPSVLTLEIGNTTLNLFSGDLLVGNCTLPNLFLRPGNHSTPVEGVIDLKKILKNIPQVLKDQASSLKDGNLNLRAIGTNVEYEGVQVPYYTKVMQTLELQAKIAVGGLLTNTIHQITSGEGNPLSNLIEPIGSKNGTKGLLSDILHKRGPGPDLGSGTDLEKFVKLLSHFV